MKHATNSALLNVIIDYEDRFQAIDNQFRGLDQRFRPQAKELPQSSGVWVSEADTLSDQFKRINDSLGHAMGDKLLCSVARRITACVRRTDNTVCRFQGRERSFKLNG